MELEQRKTGTTTVGLVCKDGIVLAADKRATAGNLIVEKRGEKIHKIIDDIGITEAGSVSDNQLLIKLLRAELKLKEVRSNKKVTVQEAANLTAGIIYGNVRRFSIIPALSHFLMGGKDSNGYHLYDLYADGSIMEINDYVSTGSGSVFAYGVLETLYDSKMSVDDGMKLAIKAINAAMQRDNASGGGIDIAVIDAKGFRKVMTKLQETNIQV
ncbi:MAG: proteasome subunit beta [Candidatus Woesearchaeota archaeon]